MAHQLGSPPDSKKCRQLKVKPITLLNGAAMLFSILNSAVTGLLDLIYPPVCAVCNEGLDAGCLCNSCIESFRRIEAPYCDRCGEPIRRDKLICRRCEHEANPHYDWSFAAFQYNGPMLRAVHRLKYDGMIGLADPLGNLFADALRSEPFFARPSPGATNSSRQFDLVVPVPLHPSRQRARGFNQAEALARTLGEQCEYPVLTNIIKRVRRTSTQTTMSSEARAMNVRGAFAVVDRGSLFQKNVLLVDDVLTSTATAREIARVLMEAGANCVCVVALARSI